MARPRIVDAFYEVDSRYAVSPAQARELFAAATEIVARYAGPLVLSSIRGARLPLGDQAATPDLRLGSAPHTALLTRRGTAADRGNAAFSPYGGVTEYVKEDASESGTKLISTVPHILEDPTGMVGLGSLVHEYGHSFGLQHFDHGRVPCAMNTTLTDANKPILAKIASGAPFCDPCAGDLELAGYTALAARL